MARGVRLNYRPDSWETERAGAEAVEPKRKSQRMRLLEQYNTEGSAMGLTDDVAARMAGLEHACYWKRCGELRDLGLIATFKIGDKVLTRKGEAGVHRIVSFITNDGLAALGKSADG